MAGQKKRKKPAPKIASERRRAPRVKTNLKARWEGELGLQDASVSSLSKLGCFVLSGGTVELKELLRLEIVFPDDEPIYLWGEVVEKAEEIGFAMQFTSLDKADRARLRKFLAPLLKTKS
jgi:hypothetical protein